MISTTPTSEDAGSETIARGAECRLARDALSRVLVGLIADEIGRSRKRSLAPSDWAHWTPETTIDEDGVGVDSLGRLDLVARVNEFFHLHEVGSEDYLLTHRSLGEWVDIVDATLSRQFQRLTFQTSGSTGAPKRVTHLVADLEAEIAAFGDILGPVARVIGCPPAHHLYGFLFTVLAPARFGARCWDARAAAPSLLGRAQAGDLVVATPHQWALMLRAQRGQAVADGVIGVSSGAPTPSEIWRGAAEIGLARLVEVFGATETAGLGWRAAGDAPFALLPTWRKVNADQLARLSAPDAPIAAPDHVDWLSDNQFRPGGRRDDAVQIGGVNIFPNKVARALAEHPMVRDCAVRPDGPGAEARLKAFVVLTEPLSGPEAEATMLRALHEHCQARMSAPEQPTSFRFGLSLPRNDMGKMTDWL